jgi:hypothetical protein
LQYLRCTLSKCRSTSTAFRGMNSLPRVAAGSYPAHLARRTLPCKHGQMQSSCGPSAARGWHIMSSGNHRMCPTVQHFSFLRLNKLVCLGGNKLNMLMGEIGLNFLFCLLVYLVLYFFPPQCVNFLIIDQITYVNTKTHVY